MMIDKFLLVFNRVIFKVLLVAAVFFALWVIFYGYDHGHFGYLEVFTLMGAYYHFATNFVSGSYFDKVMKEFSELQENGKRRG